MVFSYKFSFILPVHNEEKILKKQIIFFINFLKKEKINKYEIILMENGSNDRSYEIIKSLAKEYTKIKYFHLEKASYGLAVKNSLLVALGEYLVVLDLDFSDLSFVRNGIKEVDSHQLIVGSKSLENGLDRRPIKDKMRTKALNLVIKYFFNYEGTDTHGIKILKNSLLLKKTVWSCFTKYEFFDTELLIRLTKTKQYKLKELKTKIKEIRPSRYSFYRRFKLCLFDFFRLISCFIFQDMVFFKTVIEKFQINADDYGLNENVNKIILAQKNAFSIKKISVLANMVSKADLLKLKKQTNGKNISLHFNLLRGKPISNPSEVSSLINKNELFESLPIFLLKLFFLRINLSEIKIELKNQFSHLVKNKINCSGVDSEQHLHVFLPIWPVVLKFSKENRLQIRSKESTLFHLKKHPLKYLFVYVFNLLFLSKLSSTDLKKEKAIYNAVIVHPGTNYD